MYCDLVTQYIQVRKLFKGGNYSRTETIRGNTVYQYQNLIFSFTWAGVVAFHKSDKIYWRLFKVKLLTYRSRMTGFAQKEWPISLAEGSFEHFKGSWAYL